MDDSRKNEKKLLAKGRATQPRKAKLKRESRGITTLKKAEDKLEAVLKREQRQQAAISAIFNCDLY